MISDDPTFGRRTSPISPARVSVALAGFAAVMGVVAVVMALSRVDAYKGIISEDGIVEYGSAAFWCLAGVTGIFSLAVKKGQSKARRGMACLLILAFLLCAGEEISWGQRILGFRGPVQLLAINKQHETNLHNIGSISVYSNAFFLLTLGFFLVLPRLRQRRDARKNSFWQILPAVPAGARSVYLIGLCTWLIIGLRFGTLGFHPVSLWGYYTQMDDEIFEFFAAYSFFAFSLLDLLCPRDSQAVVEPD